MNKELIAIIVDEVRRNYRTESDFYTKTLGITQQSWNRWKRGERGLKEENMSLIRALFTPYEWMLVNKVASDMSMYPSNFSTEPFQVYTEAKRSIAKEWAERATISVNSAMNVDDPSLGQTSPGTAVTVSIEYDNGLINSTDTIVFYTEESSGRIKAGKQYRLEWFMKNVDNLN